MKQLAGILALCTLMALILYYPRARHGWRLVWEDDFNDSITFDPAAWTKIPRGTSDWNNYMSDFDSCYAVRDGNLILRGLVNYRFPADSVPFLTGGVYTKDKVTFENGLIEIRAKLHAATGAWPAIWLLPQGEKWPDGGEIDIMERLNGDSIAYQTVHTHYTYTLGIKDPPQGATGVIDPDGYNVYAVELSADSLTFFINGTHTFSYPRIETDQEGQYPFNRPFYLLIDMQLGGSWVGEVDSTDLPVEMWVDWVRFYQKK